RAQFDEKVQSAAVESSITAHDRFGRPSVREQLDAGKLDQTFAPVRVLADSPAKAAGGVSEASTTMGQALDVMNAANERLLIVSPYFVPGEQGMALLQNAADKHVHTIMMTNSFGATDEPVVHQGYSRYRKAMLKMGVKVLELGSTLTRKSGEL